MVPHTLHPAQAQIWRHKGTSTLKTNQYLIPNTINPAIIQLDSIVAAPIVSTSGLHLAFNLAFPETCRGPYTPLPSSNGKTNPTHSPAPHPLGPTFSMQTRQISLATPAPFSSSSDLRRKTQCIGRVERPNCHRGGFPPGSANQHSPSLRNKNVKHVALLCGSTHGAQPQAPISYFAVAAMGMNTENSPISRQTLTNTASPTLRFGNVQGRHILHSTVSATKQTETPSAPVSHPPCNRAARFLPTCHRRTARLRQIEPQPLRQQQNIANQVAPGRPHVAVHLPPVLVKQKRGHFLQIPPPRQLLRALRLINDHPRKGNAALEGFC